MNNKIQLSGIFSEGYGFVPKTLMKAKDIRSNTKLILCYMLSYTGAGRSCYPSLETMRTDLNVSKRTVVRCLNEALDMGYISKEKRHLGQGKGSYNYYNMLFMGSFASDKLSKNDFASDKNDFASDKNDFASDKNDTLLVTPGNLNNNNNKSNNNKSKEIKNTYLEFVKLTKKQHDKLLKDYDSEIVGEYIDRLNNYIGSKGTRYKSHYHTLLNWFRNNNIFKLKTESKILLPKNDRNLEALTLEELNEFS